MTRAEFMSPLIACMIILSGGPAAAQDAGKTAYLSSCAPCHGADAKGAGPLALTYKLQPPALTGIARRNDGQFPTDAVNEVVDGRKFVEAHGTREMPIWGFDVMVRNRIAAIVDYLRTIQEK